MRSLAPVPHFPSPLPAGSPSSARGRAILSPPLRGACDRCLRVLLQIVRLPLFCLSGFIAEFQASSALPGCVRMVDLLVMLRCFVEVYWADGRVLGRFKSGWQLESC